MEKLKNLDWEIICSAYGGLTLFTVGMALEFSLEIACIITGIILMSSGYGGGLLEQVLAHRQKLAEISAHVRNRK